MLGNNNPYNLQVTAGVCCILRLVRRIWPVHGSYTGRCGRCGRCMIYTDRGLQILPGVKVMVMDWVGLGLGSGKETVAFRSAQGMGMVLRLELRSAVVVRVTIRVSVMVWVIYGRPME